MYVHSSLHNTIHLAQYKQTYIHTYISTWIIFFTLSICGIFFFWVQWTQFMSYENNYHLIYLRKKSHLHIHTHGLYLSAYIFGYIHTYIGYMVWFSNFNSIYVHMYYEVLKYNGYSTSYLVQLFLLNSSKVGCYTYICIWKIYVCRHI